MGLPRIQCPLRLKEVVLAYVLVIALVLQV